MPAPNAIIPDKLARLIASASVPRVVDLRDGVAECIPGSTFPAHPDPTGWGYAAGCGSAWKKDPGSGVIGVEKGPLIPVV